MDEQVRKILRTELDGKKLYRTTLRKNLRELNQLIECLEIKLGPEDAEEDMDTWRRLKRIRDTQP